MANFIQFRRARRTSTSSVYVQLLSSLANDLDHMLNELCTTPPPPYDRLTDKQLRDRSDAFLEPYLQVIGDRQSPPGVGAPATPSPPPACRIAPCLLPAPVSRTLSRESLISSNGGGSEAGSEDSTDTGYGAACDIGLVERLIRSHPIWFLPGIQRAGAFHLLQGKEEGSFVVRQSSQPDTMALSVRLPPDKGPYIEHYLIQSCGGRLGLETSENRFDNMPALVAHYANCCDELPVQLALPRAIREAKSRQQLSSMALLGQEFWRYSPPPSTVSSPDAGADLALALNPLMSTFKRSEPVAPTTLSTLSTPQLRPARPNTLDIVNSTDPITKQSGQSFVKSNESASRIPPPPPPRWSKSSTPQNNTTANNNNNNNGNITVTTTVTFSLKPESPKSEFSSQVMQVVCEPKRMSPDGQCTSIVSSSSKEDSLRRVKTESLTSPADSVLSPGSDPSSLISPDTLSPLSLSKTARHSKRTRHKISRHYQESDILESPTVYNRSTVGDKISDYEDLWSSNEQHSSFKPKSNKNLPSPDLLAHTTAQQQQPHQLQNVVSLNNNVLSPGTPSSIRQLQNRLSSPQIPQPPETGSSDTLPFLPKQNSPFYAEPADSLGAAITGPTKRLPGRNLVPIQQRHSNPPVLGLHSALLNPSSDKLEMAEFAATTATISSSVGNLSPKQQVNVSKRPDIKTFQTSLMTTRSRTNDTWQIDNSWKFVGSECDINMDSSDVDYDSDWPSVPPFLSLSPCTPEPEDCTTIQDMIAQRFPDIKTSTDTVFDEDLCRMSSYDNVLEDRDVPRAPPSEISETTEFSDPWTETGQGMVSTVTESDDTLSSSTVKMTSVGRAKSFKDRLDPLLSVPRLRALRNREEGNINVGGAIRRYALELAQDKTTTFAQNIDNFIACTCESKETNPQVVMRNMRQFMSGMKNYLVKNGEKGFDKEVEKERNHLSSTQFLNLDAILEGVLHRLVVRPLKGHLHKLFIDHYTKSGAIRLLADNIQYATTRPISELAIKSTIKPPSDAVLQTISDFLNRLQAADSPLEKLEYLLAAIATIFNSVKLNSITPGSNRGLVLGADDFLPLFVWVLVKTKFIAAEIEAEYMWGLLHPSLLSGEGGYYLTTLSSAVHVLKNFKESNEQTSDKKHLKPDSVLKVVVPDELHGSILTKTLPARPHMTTKEVCKIIAHKARITNPQDYALYRLVEGEETMLADNECPQDFMNKGRHVMLAYKRIDAKIAWPKQQST